MLTGAWLLAIAGTDAIHAATADLLVTANAPELNQGRIKGGLRVMSADSFHLNSGITIDGALIVPGTPRIQWNGTSVAPTLTDGNGAILPDTHRITINGGTILGGIQRRTDPDLLPTVPSPATGSGTRNVNINQATDSPGDFKTIHSLTIHSQGATLTLPPGRYERITLNGGCNLRLQAGTPQAPALFEVQGFDCNGGSHLSVDGPVILRIRNSVNLNGYVGNAAHPEWTDLQISNGSLTLNSASAFHGKAVVPNGRLTVNGNSLVHGLALSGNFTLNGGTIECEGQGGTPNLPPTVSSCEASAEIGTPVAIPLHAVDPENAMLQFTITRAPSQGEVWIDGATAIYSPQLGFIGDDSFEFTVSDGSLVSQPASVTIHVFQPNRPPSAVGQAFIVNQGESNAPITLSATDPDGDTVIYQLVSQPTQGIITGTAPNLLYSHTGIRSFSVQQDTFTFAATDSHGAVSSPATVTLQLQPVNRPPSASAIAISVNEDEIVPIQLAATDPDSDPLLYAIIPDPSTPQAPAGPAHGTLTGTPPNLVYQPNENFHGIDRFFYQADDGKQTSPPVDVNVTVNPVNDVPLAQAKEVTGMEDQSIDIELLGLDTDGDLLEFAVSLPDDFPGTITLTGSTAHLIPTENFHGMGSFEYSVTDPSGASARAEVSFSILPLNDPPVIQVESDPWSVEEDATLFIPQAGSDVDGDALAATILAFPRHGILTKNPDGGWNYAPFPDFYGLDSFTYVVSDGSESSEPADVWINVGSANDLPTTRELTLSLEEDESTAIHLPGYDVDGDPLTFHITTEPQHGTLTGTAPNLTYTPESNYHGPDSFTFVVTDGIDSSQPATVSLFIHPVNDPPVALGQSLAIAEDEEVPILLAGTDVEHANLVFSISNPPAHGILTGTPPHLVYKPALDFHGEDSFSFTASDPVSSSAPAVVTLTISPVNDPPVAQTASQVVPEDGLATIVLLGADVDGDPISFELTSLPRHGVLSGSPPDLIYQPNPNFHGTDEFSFAARDREYQSPVATVSITVTPTNDAPSGIDFQMHAQEDQSLQIQLAGSDPDGDELSFHILEAPRHGEISGSPPALIYTPEADYHGEDSLRFVVNDGLLDSQAATMTITVHPVDDAPIAMASAHVVRQRESVIFTLEGSSADGDSLSHYILVPPAHGAISGDAPIFTYTPDVSFHGMDSLTFVSVANRSGLESMPAPVTFEVTPNNLAPIAPDMEVVLDELPVQVLLTASDPESFPLSYTIGDEASPFLWITGFAPNLTLARLQSEAAETSFSYTVTDDAGLSATGTIRVKILDPNFPPTVSGPVSLSMPEDATLAFRVNAVDPNNDPLSYFIDLPAGSPCIIEGSGPEFLLRLAPNYSGNTTFTARVEDGRGGSASRTMFLSVSAANDAPVLNPGSPTTREDTPIALALLAADPEGSAVSYTLQSSPLHGKLTGSLPNVTYLPDPNFNGDDRFVLSVSDGSLSASVSVPVLVTPVNDPPTVERITRKFTGREVSFALQGTDPDGDALDYRLLAPSGIGSATIAGNLLTFASDEIFFGNLHLSYVANDGTQDSPPAAILLTGGSAPEGRIMSPLTGARLAAGETVQVQTDAHDADGVIIRYDLLANGTPVASASSPSFAWTPTQTGTTHLSLKVTDDSALSFTSAPFPITVTGQNQAPVVFAGSDHNVFPLGLGPNLISNGGCELPTDNSGNPPFWQIVPDSQSLTRANVESFNPPNVGSSPYRYFPAAAEGAWYFGPKNAEDAAYTQNTAKLTQVVQLTGASHYLFKAKLQAHLPAGAIPSTPEYRQPRIELQFLDVSGTPISTRLIQGKIPDNTWYPVSLNLDPPVGSASARVTLIAYREPGCGLFHYSLFDDVALYPVVETSPVNLNAVVSDDGLPTYGQLTVHWEQIEGAEAEIAQQESAETPVTFSGLGKHVFKITASDGEKSVSDTVDINVGSATDENTPPSISLASEISVLIGSTQHLLSATVTDDGRPGTALYHYWEQLSGPAPASFADPRAASTTFSVTVPGAYVFRLTSHDGSLAAQREIHVQANCETIRQPIDLYIITDHTPSMFGPEPGVITDSDPRTPIYQARKLVNTLLLSMDPAKDRVSINKNDSAPTNTAMAFTSDFAFAATKVVKPYGENLVEGYSSLAIPAIQRAVPYVQANGRSGARKIILHLNDGVSGAPDPTPTAAQIAAYGITTFSVTMPNMKNDPINRLEISKFVSTPAHAFVVSSMSDSTVLDAFFKTAFSSLCRGYNTPPSVKAGSAAYLPSVLSIFQPEATVTDDQEIDALSCTWSQVSGPAPSIISDANVLRPSVRFTQPGSYLLKLTVADGSSSASDTVTIMVGATNPTPTPGGLVAYWPFDGTMRDQVGNRTLAPHYPTMPAVFASDSRSGQSIDLTGRTHPFHQIDGELFKLHGSLGGMAVSFWCKTPTTANSGMILQFAGYSTRMDGQPNASSPALGVFYDPPNKRMRFDFELQNMASTSLASHPSLGTVEPGQWNHMVINYDPASGLLSIHTNGVPTNTASFSPAQAPVFARNGQGLCLGAAPNNSGVIDWATVSAQPMFKGIVDELAVFNRSLTSQDIANLVGRNSGLVPPSLNPPPIVDAGQDRVASLSQAELLLEGLASDDDASLHVRWTLQSGPTTGCTLMDPSQAQTIAAFSQPGIYTLKLEADDGCHVVSDTVEIRVEQPCSGILPSQALLWLKGNGDVEDAVSGNDGIWLNTATYVDGKVAKAFDFTGASTWLECAAAGLATASEFTIEGWFKDNSNGLSDQNLFEVTSSGLLNDGNSLKATTRATSGGIRYIQVQVPYLDNSGVTRTATFLSSASLGSHSHPLGAFYHLAVTFTRNSGLSFFVNGVQIRNEASPSNLANLKLPSNPILRLGGRNSQQVYPRLSVDELSVYSRRLDPSEVLSIQQAGSAGKCPPWAQSPANSAFVDAGSSVILTAPGSHTFAGTFEPADFSASPAVSWLLASGPAPIDLTGSSTLAPSATFQTPGRYIFRLNVTDGVKSGSDTVIVDLLRAGNQAPLIEWNPPSSLQLPSNTLVFAPTITDDALPNGSLGSTWRVLSGPGSVSFLEIPSTSDRFDVTARFSEPGIYQIELLASDALLKCNRIFEVEVLPEPEPPPANTAPLFSLGSDIIAVSKTVHLFPSIIDDGKPSHQLSATWNYDRGPASPTIDSPVEATAPEAYITFPAPGSYDIRLTVSDGELASSDVVTIEVPATLFGPGFNAPPVLNAMEPQVVVRPSNQITLSPSFNDPDGPATTYAYAWEQVGGPAILSFSSNNHSTNTISLPELGTYTVKFTLTDGPFVRSTYITIQHLAQPNAAPTLTLSPGDGQAIPMSTVTLTATATDDGTPDVLTYEWDWLSSPDAGVPVFSAPNSAVTQVTFPAAGDYTLYCRVSDGELSKHQTVSWRVVGEPFFEIISPQMDSTISDELVPEVHIRAFQDGGIVNSVTLNLDGGNLGQAKLEPDSVDYFMKLPPILHGSHTLNATLTLGDGTILTRSSTFQLADFAEEALELEIESPHEYTDDVTAPVQVVGTVRSPQLKDYKLEIAPIDSPQSKRVIASGSTQITSAVIGTLDPSLLQNGLHVLTLSGTTTNGLYAATTEKVMIDGNMKLGQFSLAFEDLSISLPGTPLSIKRCYDSRDAKGGDFGPGWSLATSAVKIRKTRPLNTGWEQAAQTSGFVANWVFQVHPTQRKRVIISFPDGRTEIFDTGIRASVPARADLPFAQRYSPIYAAKYLFTPVGSTQGRLEVEGDTEITWLGTANDFVNTPVIEGQFTAYSEATSNPTRFRYTEPGGASYIIDETLGLMAISDANGNTVTINRGGVHHSAGESLLFTRDTAGRITKITDPSGKFLTYQYDTQGRLVTFTNRVGGTNKFVYANAAFPHYLTAIDDGKNVRAVRTNYDAEGRMISQTDANGRSVTFTHSVSNRRETVTDRLGNLTVHEFDDVGNIIRSINPLGGVTTRTYDARDNETSVTSPLGHSIGRDFDSNDNLLSETDPLGNVTRYSYDSEHRPLTITDALRHASVMNYGTSGNLLAMTDPSGAATGFAYGTNGTLASITDTNGTVTSYTHDAKGREKSMKVTTADGSTLASEAYDYDLTGNRIRSITFDGTRYLTTTFAYDAENRLYQTTRPDGTITTTNYDANGKVISQSSPAGTTTFTYDTRGNLTKTTYPGSNRFTSIGYDLEGRKTSSTDLAGNTTYTLYDALGRATATILPDATMPATVLTEVADIAAAPPLSDNPRILTSYDPDGRVTSTTDPNGNTTSYEYDDAGRRCAVLNALGQRVSFTYDAAGHQTSVTDAKGNTTSYTYDSAGRLTRTDLPDGTYALSAYDTLGRRISSTDAEGHTTRYTYDPQGRLLAVTDPLGNTTRYTYDWRGQQTSQTDALGRVTRYEYDVMGRRTARVLPEGQREEMTYNTLGQLTAHTDFNGQSITRTYEAFTQNLLSIVAPASHPSLTLSHAPARYDFTYDTLGRRTGSIVRSKVGSILSQESYTYDKQSRLSSYSGPTGGIGYAYDLAGNLSGAKSNTPGGYDLSYDYDALNRLVMVYRGQQGIDPTSTELAACNYDPNGNLNGTGYANGIQHAYTYNTLNRLTNLTVTSSDPQSTIPNSQSLQGYTYQLDRNGLRTHIAELSGRSISNTFDALQRLTRETISSPLITDHPALGTLTYSYDAASNRTSRTSTGSVSQLLPNQSHSFTANDHLTSDTYDANGNTTQSSPGLQSDSSSTDVYSFDNRLIRRSLTDGTTIDLTYNPDGHRLTKLVSNSGLTQRVHHYLTDPNNPTGYSQVVEERDPLAPTGQQLQKVHLYGHDLISSLITDHSAPITSQHFYQYDGLGSVRGISDEDGNLEETYDYDAYGNLVGLAKRNASGVLESSLLTDHSALITKSEFLFTGEQYDTDLGLYFLRARYLNTQTGRFHTQDTYEGRNGEPATLHKYAYCHGNPVSNIDPSGHTSLPAQAATAASLTGLAGMSFTFVNMALTSAGVSPSITIRLEGFNRLLFGASAMFSAIAVAPGAPALSCALFAWGFDEMQAGWTQLITGVHQHSQFANLLAALGVPHADFIAGATPGILMLPKFVIAGYRLVTGMMEKVATRSLASATARTGAEVFDDLAAQATKNAEAPAVVLGKFDASKFGGQPYNVVAANNKLTYFELENWDDLFQQFGDDVWQINESFLDQQWRAGKEFYFSHNPWEASSLGGPGNFYEKEISHMIELGVRDFEEVSNGLWKAIR